MSNDKGVDVGVILEERGSRYGEFSSHARISQRIKRVLADSFYEVKCKYMDEVLAADQLEALDMIAHKLGRIINGDPDYADSWTDIAGYAKLVADRLNKKES